MSRKVIVLNLALVALAAALIWLLRVHWLEARAHERAIFEQAARLKAMPAPPPAPAPKPASASEYIEVAQKMLFSKDRNPNIAIEVPPPPPPPPPMPALPHYHGQMAISDPVIVLSIDPNPTQKSYHAGEKIGPFEVVSFDREKITLDWNGKTVERKVQELVSKEAPPPPQQAVAAAAAPAAQSSSKALGGAASTNLDVKKNPVLGNDSGGGFFSCVAGENSPSGTVVDGYKKIISTGMFGQVCHWELVK